MSDDHLLTFFDLCDEDKDGFVTRAELTKFFKSQKYAEKFIDDYMKLFDHNQDGKISREEYAVTVKSLSVKDKELTVWKTIFDLWDKDGNGYITIDEVEQVLKECGQKGCRYTINDFEHFMKKYDTNNDGRIDYQEFLQFLLEKS